MTNTEYTDHKWSKREERLIMEYTAINKDEAILGWNQLVELLGNPE